MKITKEKLKRDFDELRRLSKEDWDYIKSNFVSTGNAIQVNKIFENIFSAIKYILLTIVGVLVAVLWACSVLALLLSHEVLLFVVLVVLLYILIAVYVKLFASQEVKDDCKRIDQFIMGL